MKQGMRSRKLNVAQSVKNDEFYTLYDDIQREVNAYIEYNPDVFRDKVVLLPCDDPEWSNFTKFFAQNFENFGIKKLISTSYAINSKKNRYPHLITIFDLLDEEYYPNIEKDEEYENKGKIFTLSRKDKNKNKYIDIEDLEWEYLEGDGDFRSDEIKKLRDQADIIVTNPPFSLYIDFVHWLIESNKKYLILGNKNSVTLKDIFPLIKDNKMWTGKTKWSGGLYFETKDENNYDKIVDGVMLKQVPSVWWTNLDHGRENDFLELMTMEDNLKYSRRKKIREQGYPKYDGYDAIEVSFTEAIPSDYDGLMGVPISFIEKYNPKQFEIIGLERYTCPKEVLVGGRLSIKGKSIYARILIRRKSK